MTLGFKSVHEENIFVNMHKAIKIFLFAYDSMYIH